MEFHIQGSFTQVVRLGTENDMSSCAEEVLKENYGKHLKTLVFMMSSWIKLSKYKKLQ